MLNQFQEVQDILDGSHAISQLSDSELDEQIDNVLELFDAYLQKDYSGNPVSKLGDRTGLFFAYGLLAGEKKLREMSRQ